LKFGIVVYTLIPAFGKLRQADHGFEPSLGYIKNSRPAWATQ
jgi:hypothetical protein